MKLLELDPSRQDWREVLLNVLEAVGERAMNTEIEDDSRLDEINEARDWQGKEVRCESCPHRELLANSNAACGWPASQTAMRGGSIAFSTGTRSWRTARWTHPYFEVRAVAAKYADVVQLPELLDDPDETVRWSAALRLPQSYLLRLIHDSHREVRIRVASRLDAADLILMMKDPDYYVRQMVAETNSGAPAAAHDSRRRS